MTPARRLFATALGISLLAHVLVLGGVAPMTHAPVTDIALPIDAQLVAPPSRIPVKPPPRVRRGVPEPAPATTPLPPLPEAAAVTEPPSPPTTAALPAEPGTPEPPPPEPLPPQPPPATAPAPASPPVAPQRVVRTLPERMTLVYDVLSGEGGFNLGQAVYTWLVQGDRYQLASQAEARGLASLFLSGQITQRSAGRISAGGMVPDQFTQGRGQRAPDSARFDWASRRLELPGGSEPLADETQDLLTFPFHLAMTVTEGEPTWQMAVTNGRRLRTYQFRLLGREALGAEPVPIDTLHVQGSRAGEGTLDVWLAPSRHWLPLRIRTQDQKGNLITLSLRPE